MARKKLIAVKVYFKYTEDGAVPNSFNINFPIVTFDGKELKGRTAKPNEWWHNFAIEQYSKITGKEIRGKDFSVERIFESKES